MDNVYTVRVIVYLGMSFVFDFIFNDAFEIIVESFSENVQLAVNKNQVLCSKPNSKICID